MNPITSFLVFVLVAGALALGYTGHLSVGVVLLAVAALVAASLKMANVWQKFVILRMGKLQSVRGAGLFVIIPVLDSVTKEQGATILMPTSMVDSLNPSAATLAFALAGNDPLANNRAAVNVDALVAKGVPAAVGNGATEPDRLPGPAA